MPELVNRCRCEDGNVSHRSSRPGNHPEIDKAVWGVAWHSLAPLPGALMRGLEPLSGA